MKLNYWKNKSLNKELIQAFEKQNIKKIDYLLKNNEVNIEDSFGISNILIDCIEKKKTKCLKYFLKNNANENKLREVHIYSKKNNLMDIEKTIILYSGESKLKIKKLMSDYRKYQSLIKNDYYYINK